MNKAGPSSRKDSALVSADILDRFAGKAEILDEQAFIEELNALLQEIIAIYMEVYNAPHNLRVQEFAALAGKSRQQIYRDLEERKLLALNAGGKGQKLPDWQLDPVKRQLTEKVLKGAEPLDPWTLYRALSGPLKSLNGQMPIDAVTVDNVDLIAEQVFGSLGIDCCQKPTASP